jgi:CheY-like chemotaxis protein
MLTTQTEEKVERRRILIIDDNHDAADTLAMMLKLTGNEVQTCYSGLDGLATAESFQPAAIMLDIGMPVVNGYETCRMIREKNWGKSIIIIALTGYGQQDDIQKSKESGFNAHLVKPLHLPDLTKLLSILLPKQE